VRVTFADKPAREILEALRAAGFRWAPARGSASAPSSRPEWRRDSLAGSAATHRLRLHHADGPPDRRAGGALSRVGVGVGRAAAGHGHAPGVRRGPGAPRLHRGRDQGARHVAEMIRLAASLAFLLALGVLPLGCTARAAPAFDSATR